MRILIALSLAAGALLMMLGTVSAAPLMLSEHAVSRVLSVTTVEPVSRRYLRKHRYSGRHVRKRRYTWTNYPYWRPYQYRHWKLYYPYGGPLF
jgi:hypothetical protein